MRLSEKKRLNLQRRRVDYDKTVSSKKITNTSAYRRPGSNKKG